MSEPMQLDIEGNETSHWELVAQRKKLPAVAPVPPAICPTHRCLLLSTGVCLSCEAADR